MPPRELAASKMWQDAFGERAQGYSYTVGVLRSNYYYNTAIKLLLNDCYKLLLNYYYLTQTTIKLLNC